jgi:hypothetical protein
MPPHARPDARRGILSGAAHFGGGVAINRRAAGRRQGIRKNWSEWHKTTGIEINVGNSGISIEKK